jgi:DNA-directed RNA polymerase subunit E'/Rpb7
MFLTFPKVNKRGRSPPSLVAFGVAFEKSRRAKRRNQNPPFNRGLRTALSPFVNFWKSYIYIYKTENSTLPTLSELEMSASKKNETPGISSGDELYLPCVVDRVVSLSILDMEESPENQITSLLREQVEGLCIKQGYVRPNTVQLRSVSAGKLSGSDIHFNTTFRADVCLPLEGMVVQCKVVTVTKAGLNCTVYDKGANVFPITVFITRQSHDDPISNVNPGDNIRVKLYASTFQINDSRICALGLVE